MPEGGRRTPIDVELEYKQYSIKTLNGYPIYIFYVNGSSYLDLPLDANVRLPSIKATPYKEMVKTLEENPHNFLLENGGINVISAKVDINKNKKRVKLNFPPGTGIVNGGHTQLAIINTKKNRDISDSIIQIQVIEHTFTAEQLATIAASRNLASNVKPYSTAEKRGYFSKIKNCMIDDFEKHIIWYENRDVPNNRGLNAVDFIARLNLFNIVFYQSNYNKDTDQPNKSATSKTTTFKFWLENQEKFLHTYPLVNDIINLEEHILSTFHKNAPKGFTTVKVIKKYTKLQTKPKTIFTGTELEWELPKQFLLPILASFRALIKYNKTSNMIGWYEKPEVVFDRLKPKILSEVTRTYKTHHNEINRMSKDKNLWRILYDTVDREIDKKGTWKDLYAISK